MQKIILTHHPVKLIEQAKSECMLVGNIEVKENTSPLQPGIRSKVYYEYDFDIANLFFAVGTINAWDTMDKIRGGYK